MVLRHEVPDMTPFTIYECKIPQCAVERQLRNDGLCIVNRSVPVYDTRMPNCPAESRSYTEDGVGYVRHVIRTPVGDLTTLEQPAGFTTWHVEKIFKGPEDYKKLLFMVNDTEYAPCYERFAETERWMGQDVILRAAIGLTPLHQIMVTWMGIETFAIEWADRQDEILKLYNALADKQRQVFPIIAKSPCLHANYGGNETGDVMGVERFEKFVLPLYNEAAGVFHKHGKLVGAHLDGNNKVWARLVARSGLDYVEAFTPKPDTDMTLQEALDAWPDKVLWVNFTSSRHVAPIEVVEQTARELIEAARPGNRFILGITEDMPEGRWQGNLLAIMKVIREMAGK
jgi:hypothetical protein